MNHETAVYLELVEEIDNSSASVTVWEMNFIESILRQANEKGDAFVMSPRQIKTIDIMKQKYLA